MLEVIEKVIIVGIILTQSYLAYKLWYKIVDYRAIFDLDKLPVITNIEVPNDVLAEGNVEEILEYKVFEEEISEEDINTSNVIYLKNQSDNNVLSTIVKYINVYLIKNKQASIDFHIIRDIVDKHSETVETQIENTIPSPLYLGLAATMIGIIMGLFSVDFGNGNEALDAVQPLINGVKWAMSASVIGLAITTTFSVKIYRDAQIEEDSEKSEFLSKLQSELMPKMTLGKLPEVSILSSKLDIFARTTTNTVTQLDKIVKTSSATVNFEKQLIEDIRKLDVAKITTANVQVFKNLDEMMDSFQNFAKYYAKLDKSMASTSSLLSNLQQFVKSTKNINSILEDIKGTVTQSNNAAAFFNKHIQSFEKYNEAVNEAVANNDAEFRKAVSQLTEATQKQYESFTVLVSGFDSKLSDAFTKSVAKFTETMDEQVRRTEEAFEKGRPQFEKLNKLDKLEAIEESLNSLEIKLSETINSGNRDLINILNNINNSVKERITNNKVLNIGDGSTKITIEQPSKTFLDKITIILKVMTYCVVIVYGAYSLLQFLNFIK
jgi:hypothetical protein